MKLTLGELKKLFPRNTIVRADEAQVLGITQDTRSLKAGDVYVAIRGENFDGHAFVAQAFEKGALAALVSDPNTPPQNAFIVTDTVLALGQIAKLYRRKFTQPLVAITGSNGKTTNKELIAHVLARAGKVVATRGNLNNHIGVPLTIFNFDDEARFFVVEMGMNHPGEIRYLAQLAEPGVGYVTSVGRAHMEGVGGTIAGVAQAKGELFAVLSPEAMAVVNGDDPLICGMPTRARRVTFGLGAANDVRGENVVFHADRTEFDIVTRGKRLPVALQLSGNHHVRNALAAFTICRHLGMEPEEIKSGLESFSIGFNRGRVIRRGNVILVDDTYNANPDSMLAAFESLALQFPAMRRIAVLGGMLELGPDALALHEGVGRGAKDAGFDEVFAYGVGGDRILQGFGYDANAVRERHFSDHGMMADAVLQALKNHGGTAAILFKGSRGMKMESVLEKFI